MANRIDFEVGYKIDQASLNQLKTQLQQLQKMTLETASAGGYQGIESELGEIKRTAQEVEIALTKAFNPNLNSLNITKFNTELSKSNLTVESIYTSFSKLGTTGVNAFRNLATQVLTTNMQLKQTNSFLDKMGTTMMNTIKWGVTSGIFNNMTRAIQKAWTFTKNLDSSLNDIRIVTGKSADQMERFARVANQGAKELGASTLDYTNASLIYYQQGLADAEVQARAETTLKAANVTGQTGEAVSEQLTAVWNGYKVSAAETELYVDKLAAVAATTASDLEELSVGMSKVASAANSMGVDVDQLNAQIATIISVTRQAPESVGTALKTIYARMGDLSIDGEDEFGTKLGDVSGKMEQMGIQVLDQTGNLRDMGTVIEEVAAKWDTWTEAQRQAAAVALAGKRQYNNLVALFDNWGMYTEALETSANAAGTLQDQQDIYMQSTEAHLQQLRTEWQRTYDIIFNQDDVNDALDGIAKLLTGVNNLFDAIGGGKNLLIGLGAILTNLFSKQIASGIEPFIANIRSLHSNAETFASMTQTVQEFKNVLALDPHADTTTQQIVDMADKITQLKGVLSPEDVNQLQEYMRALNEAQNAITAFEQKKEKASQIRFDLLGEGISEEDWVKLTNLNTDEAQAALIAFNKKLDTVEKSLGEDEKAVRDFERALSNLIKTEQAYNQDTSEEKYEAFSVSVDKAKESYENFLQTAKEVAVSDVLSASTRDALMNGIKEAENLYKANGGDLYGSAEVEASLRSLSEKYGIAVEEIKAKLKEVRTTAGEVASGVQEEMSQGAERAASAFQQHLQKAFDVKNIQNITRLVGGVQSLGFALAQVNQITDNFIDGNYGQALLGMSMAAGSATQSILTLSKALQTAGVAASTANIVLIAIAASLAIVTALYQNAKRENEAFNATQKETYDNAIAARDAAVANEELFKSYQDLYQQYKAGVDVKEELNSVTDELKLALGEESSVVAQLTGDYEKLNAQIIESRRQSLQDALESSQEAKDAAESRLYSTARSTSQVTDYGENGKNIYGLFNAGFVQDTKSLTSIRSDAVAEIVNQEGSKLSFHTGQNPGIKDGIQFTLDDTDYEGWIQTYHQLEAIREALKESGDISSDFAISINEYLKAMSENVGEYETAVQSVLEYQGKLGILDNSEWDTLKEFEEARQEVIDLLKDSPGNNDKTDEELKSLANQWMSDITDSANNYIAKSVLVDELVDKWGESTRDKMIETVDSLDEMQLNVLSSILQDLDVSAEQFIAHVETYIERAKAIAEHNTILVQIDTVQNAQDTISSGGELDEDSVKTLQDVFGSLKDEQDEYIVDWEKFNLAGPIDQLQMLSDATDVLVQKNWEAYEAEVQSTEEAKQALEERRAELERQLQLYERMAEQEDANPVLGAPDPSTLEHIRQIREQLEGLEDQYDVTVDIDLEETALDNLSLIVNDIVSQADALKSAAEMIGEGFLVAKEDAHEFASVYPELLEQAEVLADGSIQLNSAVVQAIMNGNAAIIAGDSQVTEKQLEDKITLLDAEIQYQQTKLEILQNLLSGALTESQAEKGLAQAENQYKEDLVNAFGLTDAEAVNQEVQNHVTSTNTNLQMLDEVDRRIAEISEHYSRMLSGEVVQAGSSNGVVGGNAASYTASNNVAESNSNLSDETRQAIQQQIEDTQSTLESLQDQRAAYTALLSDLKAGTKDAVDAMNGAAAGTGGKIDKDGKSGSSKKEKDPDHMDYLDDEIDKYHDINNELKQIAANLKLIQGQEDKYIRAGLTYNLEKQLEVLKQQEDAQRRKLALAQADLKAQAALLQAKGVQIGEDGQILNYAGILAAKQAEINALIAEYNGLSAADQEGYKQVIEQKKQEYEQLKSQMAAYDTLLNDTIPNLISDIQDTIDAQIEAQIKKFNVMIEAHLDIKDLEEEWNKFKAKVILDLDDDDYIGKAQNAMERFYNYYRSDGTGIVQELTKHVNDIADQIRQIEATGTSSIYGDNEAQAMEDLRKYNTELMNSLEEIKDLEEEVYDDYLDLIDKAQDAFDQQVETYEQISDIIEHDMELTRLLWGDDAYDTLDKYYTMQEQNNNQQLDFLRQQADMWKNLMDNEEEGSEAWEKYRDNWMSAVSDLNSLVEDSVQNLLDKYANTMSKIIDDLNKKITGGKGLDYVSEEWDLINREADQYLDTINAGYAIQKLENEINQSLNDLQGNVAAQQALNKLRDEELQKLKDKEKITEYDVERAELMYQIALKQIALEQAQQNKSSMRLRRDSQGNYTYQYVADDNQIAEAQQALNEAQNNLFNLDKDAYRENLDNIYEIYNEFQEKVLELYQDMTLSDEEREEKKALYAEYYGNLINNLVTENEYIRLNLMDSTFQSLAELYNQDVENFYNMSQAEQDELINSIVPQWNTSIQQMADEFAGEGGFIPTCQEAFMQLDETTQYYRQSLDNLAAAAGIDFNYIAAGIDLTIGQTQALLANNGELINQYQNEINIIQSVVASLQNLISSYQGAQAAAIAAAAAARELYEAANGAAAAVNNMMNALSGGGGGGGGSTGGGDGGSSGGTSGNNNLSASDIEGIAGNIWVYGDWGNNPTRYSTMVEKFGQENGTAIYQAVQDKFNSGYGYNGGLEHDWDYYKKFSPSAYATGGYTGDWAGEGKLGILHQKELVLNDEDTANILDAVKIIRTIAAKAAGVGVSLSDMSTNTGTVGYGESIEQSVHIDAQFPNVTNSDEIQNAFNDLMNMASQYANANRRKK